VNPVESWATIYTLAAALLGLFLGANAWLDRRAARRRRRAWEQHTEQALRNAHPSARCPLGCGKPVWDRQMHMMLWHAPRRPRGPEDRPDWGADQ
jgi:hypothetical protein